MEKTLAMVFIILLMGCLGLACNGGSYPTGQATPGTHSGY